MSNYWCTVPECKSDTRKLGQYGFMKDVRFYPYPTKAKNPRTRSKWLQLIRRPSDYDPARHHRVCSRHFVDAEPTECNPYPTLFPWNNYGKPEERRSTSSIKKRELLNTSSSSLDDQTCTEADSDTDEEDRSILEASGCDIPVESFQTCRTEPESEKDSTAPLDKSLDLRDTDHTYMYADYDKGVPVKYKDSCIQTDLTVDQIEEMERDSEQLKDKECLHRNLIVEKIIESDKTVKEYTGFPSKKILNGVFDLVNDACPVLKYWSGSKSGDEKNYQRDENIKKGGPERKLSRYQEFLLTLLKLRLNLLTFFLADIFGVSPTRVSQVYTTWINVMSSVFSRTIRMPDRTLVKKHMTPAFKKDFPDTTAIIDCTEIPIEKPRQPKAQSLTYSSYKSRNTLKALVSITPTGAFNFISDLWGGNTSDRYITKESGFLDCVRPGDEIMADRGFLIRDLLLERRAKLVIPPFTKKCKGGKGKRLLNRDIFKTRKIAKHRIQVERAIQRLKTFKLLSDTMPVSLQHVANPSLKVAGFICNLNRPLVK